MTARKVREGSTDLAETEERLVAEAGIDPANGRVLINRDDGVRPWVQADADWFQLNPGRRFRIRNAASEEFELPALVAPSVPAGYVALVVVRQETPGVRVRAMAWFPAGTTFPEGEPRLRRLMEWLRTTGRIVLDPDDAARFGARIAH